MRINDQFQEVLRRIRERALESVIIVVTTAVGIAAVTAGLALVEGGNRARATLTETLAGRELVVSARNEDFRLFFPGGVLQPVVPAASSDAPAPVFQQSNLDGLRRDANTLKYAYLNAFALLPALSSDGSRQEPLQVRAISGEYAAAARLRIVEGAYFTANDFADRARSLLITRAYANRRFGSGEAVGKTIALGDGGSYRILGVFEPAVQTFDFDPQRGAVGIVPFGSAPQPMDLRQLNFAVERGSEVNVALQALTRATERRFGSGAVVTSQRATIDRSATLNLNAQIVTTALSAGGLFVAAINITQLMLARVRASGRGIGIGMALGASRRWIFSTYLLESSALSLTGGVLGVALAGAVANLFSTALGAQAGTVALLPWHLALGVLLAGFVGIAFGFLPALVAVRTAPSALLRG